MSLSQFWLLREMTFKESKIQMVYWCLSESADLIQSRCGWNLQQFKALCLLSGSVFIIDGTHSERTMFHVLFSMVVNFSVTRHIFSCLTTSYIYLTPINIPVIPLTSENYVLAYNYAPPLLGEILAFRKHIFRCYYLLLSFVFHSGDKLGWIFPCSINLCLEDGLEQGCGNSRPLGRVSCRF